MMSLAPSSKAIEIICTGAYIVKVYYSKLNYKLKLEVFEKSDPRKTRRTRKIMKPVMERRKTRRRKIKRTKRIKKTKRRMKMTDTLLVVIYF